MPALATRAIDDLSDYIRKGIAAGDFPEGEQELQHYFADGLYGRCCSIKAGHLFTTKVHKKEHLAFCLKGKIVVRDEHGNKRIIEAPYVMVTPAGTQRAIYVVEDVMWTTVHAYEGTQDIGIIETVLGCDSMGEYQRLLTHEV